MKNYEDNFGYFDLDDDPDEAAFFALVKAESKLGRPSRRLRAGQSARKTAVTPNQLKAARTALGLTQAEFARAFHVSPRAIGGWEQG